MDRVDVDTLLAQGWTRRNVACEPRLGELVQIYKDLGAEVQLIPLASLCPEDGAEAPCTRCFEGERDPARYQVIFTRPASAETGAKDELF